MLPSAMGTVARVLVVRPSHPVHLVGFSRGNTLRVLVIRNVRGLVCAFARSVLGLSVLLSKSIVIVPASKKSGWATIRRCSASYSTKVTFTLVWEFIHSAGKLAAARNTSTDPGVPRTTPAQVEEDLSVAPVMGSGWCDEWLHNVPLIREQTSSQSSISDHSLLFDATGIPVEEYPAFWYRLTFLYTWYV